MADAAAGAVKFTVRVERADARVVAYCGGRLIAGDGSSFFDLVGPLVEGTKDLVLDLTELEYMDSLGLGMIARLYVSARTHGCHVQLVNLAPRVKKLLDVTKLLSVFTVCGESDIRIL